MRTFALAGLAALILSPIAQAQSANWQAEQTVDAFTDRTRYGALTFGDEISAAFMCDDTPFIAFSVVTGPLDLEMGQQREVTWRVDQEEAVTSSWINIRRGGAMALDEEAIEIARAVRDAQDRFVVRSGRRTVTFSVRGSSEAINATLNQCGISAE